MKVAADRLASHLGRTLAPLYVLTGDEPLLVDEARAAIRERCVAAGCGDREYFVAERSFDWDGFAAGLQNLSLFASRRLIELRLPTGKPGEAGARVLATLAAQASANDVVLILLPALDSATARSKWATALAGAAVWIECRPPRHEELPAWLGARMRGAGLKPDAEALEELAARVEGNLLAAKQEIDKLALLVEGGAVSAQAVRESVADGARFDVFQLSDAALARDVGRSLRVLAGLEREGESEVLVLWALVREILGLADVVMRAQRGRTLDQAMNDAGIWRSRQELVRRAARGRGIAEVGRLLGSAARADQIVKGVRPGQAWNALGELVLELGGARVPRAETA